MATQTKRDFNLKDYLGPNGRRPYAALAADLEDALKNGESVYLWSVPGFLMLAGHPDGELSKRPWSDGQKWYASAKDALAGKNGRK